MPNIQIQNNKTRGIVIWDPVFEDDILTLAGADTLLAGTLLARDSVSLKLVLFVKGGATNENGIPKAVLLNELVVTGAGDFPLRPVISGRLRAGDLVIDADQDASNIDKAVLDQLRDFTIIGQATVQLAELDNQP